MKQIGIKEMLARVTEIYIFIMIILFPLCVDSTGFFNILECKYRCFLIINTIYISVILITILYYKLFKNINCFKEYKLGKVQWAVILFMIINIVATVLSPFLRKYNLLVGVGRGEGLITIILYCLSFINISLFGNFKKRYVLYFSISSIVVSFISILQYIGFNPFNMYQQGIGTHNVSFIGTIGNIDFVSTFYCICLTISMTAFVFLKDNRTYEKIIYLASIFLGFFIFEVLDVLSGAIAFAGILILTIPFIITNNERLSKLLVVGAMILLGYFTNIIINPVYHYNIQKLILEFQINYTAIALLVMIFLFIVLSHILKKMEFDLSGNKKIVMALYTTIFCCIIIGVIGIYCINFETGFLYEIHEILHGNFDDDFGTYRIFLWKRSLELVKDYPIIGTGPDTFAIRFMEKYTNDIRQIGELTINDTAANSYLTILVNLGIVGLGSYLICIGAQIFNAIKNMNEYAIIFLVTLACFLIQDFFNLWVVIVTPLFWILMAILYISTKNINKGDKKYE